MKDAYQICECAREEEKKNLGWFSALPLAEFLGLSAEIVQFVKNVTIKATH